MTTNEINAPARHRNTAAVCHRVIATLAARTHTPDIHMILAAVDDALPHLLPNEGRAYRQNAAGAVRTYFAHLVPEQSWTFHGAEAQLREEDADLLWLGPDGSLLMDQVTTGASPLFPTTSTLVHARRQLAQNRRVFGPRLRGLRLLCLSDARRSLFLRPTR